MISCLIWFSSACLCVSVSMIIIILLLDFLLISSLSMLAPLSTVCLNSIACATFYYALCVWRNTNIPWFLASQTCLANAFKFYKVNNVIVRIEIRIRFRRWQPFSIQCNSFVLTFFCLSTCHAVQYNTNYAPVNAYRCFGLHEIVQVYLIMAFAFEVKSYSFNFRE